MAITAAQMKNFISPMISRVRDWGIYFNNIGFRLAIWYAIARFLLSFHPLVASSGSIATEVLFMMVAKRDAITESPDVPVFPKDPVLVEPDGATDMLHKQVIGEELVLGDGMLVMKHD